MRLALVTGASGVLGSAIARRLASSGHRLLVHANRNAAAAEALAGELRQSGAEAEAVVFDVTDGQSAHLSLEALIERLGPVQILVNNAGVHEDAPMAGMDAGQWQRVIDVSLNGFFNVTQPLLMPMMRARWGRIVNVSSVAARLGNQGQVNYAAAKAGLHGATRSLSREVASRGITVNVVAPGVIDSQMTRDLLDTQKMKRLVPAARMGRPEEVAAVVDFLAGEEAGYLSGQIIGVDGGMT